MLSKQDALIIVERGFPKDVIIKPPVSYKNLWLFQVFQPDPDEGSFDPYFSVDKTTGELKDFSIFSDGDTNQIIQLFVQSQKAGT